MSENEGENTQSIPELLEAAMQVESDDQSSDDRTKRGSLGRHLGGIVGCGVGLVVGRKLGESLEMRVEGHPERIKLEASQEERLRKRVQNALDVSKREAKQIIAAADIRGDEAVEDAEPETENENSETEPEDESGGRPDLNDLSDDDLRSLANDLFDELERRKAAQ
ncbi:hypothetical protein [Haladaptatus cibarius]|uniref:hypothetical protein n=1 Tax=Haladaptatus cibarius TaxID=453847 RepID=UPI0011859037|nr:hypothetical protein [Haladaptatus cibarius]